MARSSGRGTRDAPNTRDFDEQLVTEVERARRHGRKLSLVMLDADHFKQINDSHGHQVGDAVLRGIGNLLRGLVRRTDVAARPKAACAARYGGEEFGIILPDADAASAAAVADRLRRRLVVEDLPGRATQPLGCITASAGVAELEPWMDAHELVRRADAALYAAKREGRNRVKVFAEELVTKAS